MPTLTPKKARKPVTIRLGWVQDFTEQMRKQKPYDAKHTGDRFDPIKTAKKDIPRTNKLYINGQKITISRDNPRTTDILKAFQQSELPSVLQTYLIEGCHQDGYKNVCATLLKAHMLEQYGLNIATKDSLYIRKIDDRHVEIIERCRVYQLANVLEPENMAKLYPHLKQGEQAIENTDHRSLIHLEARSIVSLEDRFALKVTHKLQSVRLRINHNPTSSFMSKGEADSLLHKFKIAMIKLFVALANAFSPRPVYRLA